MNELQTVQLELEGTVLRDELLVVFRSPLQRGLQVLLFTLVQDLVEFEERLTVVRFNFQTRLLRQKIRDTDLTLSQKMFSYGLVEQIARVPRENVLLRGSAEV